MKRPLNNKSIEKEAAFWDNLKKVLRENPAKICHK